MNGNGFRMERVGLGFVLLATALLSFGPVSAADVADGDASAVEGKKVDSGVAQVSGEWHSSRLTGGGYLLGVEAAPSDPKRLYCRSDVGGLFRSDDAGRTWRMLHGSLPAMRGSNGIAGLVVDPRDADRLVIAAGDMWAELPSGIYVSEDGGKTWRQTLKARFHGNGPNRGAGRTLVRHPANPDYLVAASIHDGVWASQDNGETWQKLGLDGLAPTVVQFDRTDPDRIWVGAIALKGWYGGFGETEFGGGFFFSEDAGKKWEKLSEDDVMEMVQDPVEATRFYGVIGGDHVMMTVDLGRTWKPIEQGLYINPVDAEKYWTSRARYLALTTGPDFVLVGSAMGDFYRLPAGGDRWESIKREKIEEGDWWGRVENSLNGWTHFGKAASDILVSPHDPNRWYFTDWFSIYRSDDAGKTWVHSSEGIETTCVNSVTIDSNDPRNVYAGVADIGFCRSRDGGKTFEQVPHTSGITSNVRSVAVKPGDSKVLVCVGTGGSGWFANQVFLSEDGGTTWRRSKMKGLPDMAEHRCNTILWGPDGKSLVLAVSGDVGSNAGGPYRSTDGGETWEWIGQGMLRNRPFYRKDIFVHGPELAVGPDGGMVTVSVDTGAAYRFDEQAGKWRGSPLYFKGRAVSVVSDPHQAGRYFVGVKHDSIYRTDDGGVTWDRLILPGGQSRDPVEKTETLPQTVGDFEPGASWVAVDSLNPGRVVAATADGLIVSNDSGESWEHLPPGMPNRTWDNPGAVAGERVIAGTNGNGIFWTNAPLPAGE